MKNGPGESAMLQILWPNHGETLEDPPFCGWVVVEWLMFGIYVCDLCFAIVVAALDETRPATVKTVEDDQYSLLVYSGSYFSFPTAKLCLLWGLQPRFAIMRLGKALDFLLNALLGNECRTGTRSLVT